MDCKKKAQTALILKPFALCWRGTVSERDIVVVQRGSKFASVGRWSGVGAAVALSGGEQFDFPRPDFDNAVIAAVFIRPDALLKLTGDADSGAFFAVFADDLRGALKGIYSEPVGLLDFVAVLVLVMLVDSDGKINNCCSAGRVLQLRVLSQVSDDDQCVHGVLL